MKKAHHRPGPRERCAAQLAACGLRVTGPRLEVYRAVAASEDHPTAEEIYHRVHRRTPKVSLATVYNCLEALSRAGLVEIMNRNHGAARYEAETDRHHHLVCRRCGKVRDLRDPELDRLLPRRAEGFAIDDVSVQFFGTCEECLREARAD